ncbi:MAG: D-alanyl-D-alanine carboxypeptidase family protein [Bacilli bacterium]|nr:D-alanyl-D-alanine carboxypeptidase family protein [Bacilli bacterium]
MKKILIILGCCICLTGCNYSSNYLKEVASTDNNSIIEFETPTFLEDNYMLNLEEDKNDYFIKNLVELTGFTPVDSHDIKINNKALFDLKDMFDNEGYQDLIVRRGYLDEKQAQTQKAYDHTTGYDIDVYIRGKKWTDFKGYKEANSMITNSYKYGFVLRYESKNNYQPWHYRYIGKTHSNLMHKEKLTVDKYIDVLNNLKDNKLYQVKNTDTFIYKITKQDVVIPKGYNYSISSLDNKYYIVDFDTEKTIHIKKTKKQNIIETDLEKLNILYDLVLVNGDNSVPAISNQNLVSLTNYLSNDNNPESLLKEEVLQKLQLMLAKANKLDRHTTYLTSAYRSATMQETLYVGGEIGSVQKPGHSEHETGLAFDLSNSYKSTDAFDTTIQGLWIQRNAHKYGFINRYPANKVDITGIKYEPWHYRYVGEIHATYINENNLALEEYLDIFEINNIYELNYNNQKYLMLKSLKQNNKLKTLIGDSQVYFLKGDEYLTIKNSK